MNSAMATYDLFCDYSTQHPKEILQVEVLSDGEEDLLLFYKGQVSSLIRATPADAGEPLWSETTQLVCLDRLQAPYDPVTPVFLAANIMPTDLNF